MSALNWAFHQFCTQNSAHSNMIVFLCSDLWYQQHHSDIIEDKFLMNTKQNYIQQSLQSSQKSVHNLNERYDFLSAATT